MEERPPFRGHEVTTSVKKIASSTIEDSGFLLSTELFLFLEEHRLEQKVISELLGVSSSAVAQWKKGKTKIHKKHHKKLWQFMEGHKRKERAADFEHFFLESSLKDDNFLNDDDIEWTAILNCVIENRRNNGNSIDLNEPDASAEIQREVRYFRYQLNNMFGLDYEQWCFLMNFFQKSNEDILKSHNKLNAAIDKYMESKRTEEDGKEMEIRLANNGDDLRNP